MLFGLALYDNQLVFLQENNNYPLFPHVNGAAALLAFHAFYEICFCELVFDLDL